MDAEKAAADLLRIFAEKNGGIFPKRLDDPEEFQKFIPKQVKPSAIPDSETFRIIQSVTRFMMATRQLKDGFGYRPNGVKLGDADKILFWYRPDGGTSYRASMVTCVRQKCPRTSSRRSPSVDYEIEPETTREMNGTNRHGRACRSPVRPETLQAGRRYLESTANRKGSRDSIEAPAALSRTKFSSYP